MWCWPAKVVVRSCRRIFRLGDRCWLMSGAPEYQENGRPTHWRAKRAWFWSGLFSRISSCGFLASCGFLEILEFVVFWKWVVFKIPPCGSRGFRGSHGSRCGKSEPPPSWATPFLHSTKQMGGIRYPTPMPLHWCGLRVQLSFRVEYKNSSWRSRPPRPCRLHRPGLSTDLKLEFREWGFKRLGA